MLVSSISVPRVPSTGRSMNPVATVPTTHPRVFDTAVRATARPGGSPRSISRRETSGKIAPRRKVGSAIASAIAIPARGTSTTGRPSQRGIFT